MSGIPTSTFVSESAVIDASFSDVWHLIKLQDFSKFWSKLEKSEFVKGTSDETDIVKWSFKDGQVLEVKQEEHSVSNTHPESLQAPISYSVLMCLVNRPLHHIQRHYLAARALVLLRRLHDPRVPRHIRQA
jgi:hypothetical protein